MKIILIKGRNIYGEVIPVGFLLVGKELLLNYKKFKSGWVTISEECVTVWTNSGGHLWINPQSPTCTIGRSGLISLLNLLLEFNNWQSPHQKVEMRDCFRIIKTDADTESARRGELRPPEWEQA